MQFLFQPSQVWPPHLDLTATAPQKPWPRRLRPPAARTAWVAPPLWISSPDWLVALALTTWRPEAWQDCWAPRQRHLGEERRSKPKTHLVLCWWCPTPSWLIKDVSLLHPKRAKPTGWIQKAAPIVFWGGVSVLILQSKLTGLWGLQALIGIFLRQLWE